MVKNAELNEVVKGLQTQMESLQAQRVEILRVLAEQSENMKALRQQSDHNMMFVRSLVQQVHNLQVSSPPKKDAAQPTPTTGLLHLCVSKVLLCSESIPTDEPRSKSDLSDLKMATVDLVGEDKHTSDLVGEIDESADLVGKSNEMDLTGKLVITADLVGDEAPVAELVETKNDEEEIAEIQTEVDGAADEVTEMTSTIVGDVDGLPKPGIVAAPLVVVMECKITVEASYEINYVAAMTNMSSKSSAKKSRREATFVKDRGKPHVAVRHCRQLGFKAASRHDGYSEQRGGGCEEAWSRRVARRRWQRRAPAKSQRRRNQAVRRGEATTTMKKREVESTRSEGKTEQGGGCEEAWSRRVTKRRRWWSVAERTSPWAAAWLSASRRVAMRRGGSKARRGRGCMKAESSSDTWEGQLESGGDKGGAVATLVVMVVKEQRQHEEIAQRRRRAQWCDLT